jgi:hypothetical protein
MKTKNIKPYHYYSLAGAVIVLGTFMIYQLNTLLVSQNIDTSSQTAAVSTPVPVREKLPVLDTAFEISPDLSKLKNSTVTSTRTGTQKSLFSPSSVGKTPHNFGYITDEAQLHLELINRTRANPRLEGLRILNTTDVATIGNIGGFGVDKVMFLDQVAPRSAVAPVAFEYRLNTAARKHNEDQLLNSFQGHTGSDGSSPQERAVREGYDWLGQGENSFSSSKNIEHGHAGYYVDWGYSTGGMQTPPGHRNIILGQPYVEVGINVMNGTNGTVGPQTSVEEFGIRKDGSEAFLTGVVYQDYNGNNFYDLGEGVDNIEVNSPNSTFYATTSYSGGYTLPVSTGASTVTFSLPNGTTLLTSNYDNTGAHPENILYRCPFVACNVKRDLVIPYTQPQISGQSTIAQGVSRTYTMNPVSTASSYTLRSTPLVAYSDILDAETGTVTGTTATLTGSYASVVSSPRASGSYGYRLAMPTATNQYIEINKTIVPSATSYLSFDSKLSWATVNQVAQVQISQVNGSRTKTIWSKVGGVLQPSIVDDSEWTTIWRKSGNSTAGDTTFKNVQIPLGFYANQAIKVRFAYVHTGSNWFNQTSSGIGFYFDNVAVTNAYSADTDAATLTTRATPSIAFTPPTNSSYLLQARANTTQRSFPWSQAFLAHPAGTVGQYGMAPFVTITTSRDGAGTISSYPLGINCRDTCKTNVPLNSTITLGATPIVGHTFLGWTGACSGTGTCSFTASTDKTVGARFASTSATQVALTATIGGGAGLISGSPQGILCGAACTTYVTSGSPVTLTATPASGYTFSSWTCTGGTVSGSNCSVIPSAATDVTATFVPSVTGTYTTTVTKAGTGSGTVTSSVGGINCGLTCTTPTALTNGTPITLTAAAAVGSTFGGWTGVSGCSTAPICNLTPSANVSATATFNLDAPTTYNLTTAVTGAGSITSSPSGTSCGTNCTTYATGQVVTLTASPTAGNAFSSWTGCGSTNGAVCTVTMSQARNVTATFITSTAAYKLTVNNTNNTSASNVGTGSITATVNGVSTAITNCSTSCTATFPSGTVVTLTATPDNATSKFRDWSGSCNGNTSPCTVTMTSAKTVNSRFRYNDTVAPTVSITSPTPNTTATNIVEVTSNATDNVYVAGVTLVVNGTPYGNEDTSAPYKNTLDAVAMTNGTYQIATRARDNSGNIATTPNQTLVVNVDRVAPSVPSITSDSASVGVANISVKWTQSTDNIAVTGYDVYRNDVKIAETGLSTNGSLLNGYNDSGLVPDTSYTYKVRAFDTIGNRSALSAPVTIRTGARFVAPSAPAVLSVGTRVKLTSSIVYTRSNNNTTLAPVNTMGTIRGGPYTITQGQYAWAIEFDGSTQENLLDQCSQENYCNGVFGTQYVVDEVNDTQGTYPLVGANMVAVPVRFSVNSNVTLSPAGFSVYANPGDTNAVTGASGDFSGRIIAGPSTVSGTYWWNLAIYGWDGSYWTTGWVKDSHIQ